MEQTSNLFVLGSFITLIGFILLLICLFYGKKEILDDYGPDNIKTTRRGREGIPFAQIRLHPLFQNAKIRGEFKEVNGRDVSLSILSVPGGIQSGELLPVLFKLIGKEGPIFASPRPGDYRIEIKSLDKDEREVELSLKTFRIEKPYEKYIAIGLTLITIGIVISVATL